MVEHGSSVSKIKEILKGQKSVQKSDEILDDLFSSIIPKASSKPSTSDEDESGSNESDSDDKRRRKKRKKEKKKKEKKTKKKRKKRMSSDEDSDSDGEDSRSRGGRKEVVGDSFWGDSKPYDPSERGEAQYRRPARRPEPEYHDERRPVDLGREARPFPSVAREPYRREEYARGAGGRGGARREEYSRAPSESPAPSEQRAPSRAPSTVSTKDGFWDSKWEGMELDSKLTERQRKGQYYLNTKKRFQEAMGEGTPSLSPSPEREERDAKKKKKRASSSEPETEELKGIKKMAAITHLTEDAVGDGKVKGVVPEIGDYEYDRVTRMYKKREAVVEKERVDEGYPEQESGEPDDKHEEDNRQKAIEVEQNNERALVALVNGEANLPAMGRMQREDGSLTTVGQRGLFTEPELPANIRVDNIPLNQFDAQKVLNPKKTKLLDPSKIAMNRAFPRAQVIKKIPKLIKPAETKEDIMEELVKEIEELENEVDDTTTSSKSPQTKATEDEPKIDWGASALGEILKESDKKKSEEKKESKPEDGEISDGVEDGEVPSDEEERKKKSKSKKRSRSKRSSSRRRRSYSRSSRRRSRSRSRRRDYSRGRSPYSRGYSPPAGRHGSGYGYCRRDNHRRSSRSRSRSRANSRDRRERRRQAEDERYEKNKRRAEKNERSMLNKSKLLEIAKKNATKILKSGGDFMGMDQTRLIAMKSGGESLDEITKFCKEISMKGLESQNKIDLLAESSSDEEEFQHPFMVKDKPLPNPITMLIGESRETLPPAARAVAKSQRMLEFPVSSGNAHRSKEGSLATPADPLGDWEPVEPEPKMTGKEKKEMEKFHEQMEQEEKALQKLGTTGNNTSDMVQSVDLALEKEKAPQGFTMKPWDKMPEESPADFVKKMNPKSWTLTEEDKDIATPKSDMFKTPIPELSKARQLELEALRPGRLGSNARAEYLMPTDMLGQLAKELPDDIAATQLGMNPLSLARQLALPTPAATAQAGKPEPTKHVSNKPDKVFENYKGVVVDIGTIVSTRLAAMRKLQVNPADAEALQDMYEAQKMMASWATSKNKPGQFVGSTGATVLSKHELNLGLQCWAKPDQFNRAEKVKGGFGEFMLKKMGWTDGEGLGKNKSGEINPLQLDIKFDKKGLMAAEEDGVKNSRRGAVATMTACKDLAGKHPVSALTELCSKRRWGPPIFTQAFECGPPHKKQYIIKVNVNGTDYMGSVAVNDKKKAKANAAMYCLQTMGLVPRDPDNPV